MKKIITLAAALASLCCCVSCTEKQEDSKGNTATDKSAVENSVGDSSPEKTDFREYTAADFKDITVKLNKQQTAPPVEIKEYDLSGIEYESKISPCQLPENIKIEYIDSFYEDNAKLLDMNVEEYSDMLIENFSSILDVPTKPQVTLTDFDGEYLYYIANFDDICLENSHNFAIYRYNPETKENTCIFEYSDSSVSMYVVDIKCFKGNVWILEYSEDSYNIYRIDSETGELVADSPMMGRDFYAANFYDTAEDDFIIMAGGSEKISENEWKTKVRFYKYDENSGEWEKMLEDGIEYEQYGTIYKGGIVKTCVENRSLIVECDSLRLDTGLRSSQFIGLTDSRAFFILSDSISTVVYVYDFEKMERYSIDLTTYGSNFTGYISGDNIILQQNMGKYYMYLIPELGAAFDLTDAQYESAKYYNWEDSESQESERLYTKYNQNGRTSSITEFFDINYVKWLSDADMTSYIPKPEERTAENTDRLNRMIVINE